MSFGLWFFLCFRFVSSQTNNIFKNNFLQFGSGSENSLNTYGLMNQPWYLSSVTNTWYKLTYSNYPIDLAIGDGTTGTNFNGNSVTYIYNSNPTYIFDNYSYFVADSISSSNFIGHGTIFSDRVYSNKYFLRSSYSLGFNDSFLKVTSVFVPYLNLTNVNIWVGVRDDYVGNSDTNIKTRGKIVNGKFIASNGTTNAIKVYNEVDAVLFFTTNENSNSAYSSCCSFSNVYSTNPLSLPSSTIVYTDGSYAIMIQLGNVTVNSTYTYNWYYSAGLLTSLDNITNAITNDVYVSQNISYSASPSISPTVTSSVILKTTTMNSTTISATSTPLFIITPYPTSTPSSSFNASTIINNFADTSTATILGGTAVGLVAVMTGVLAALHIKIPDNVKENLFKWVNTVRNLCKRVGIDPVKVIEKKLNLGTVLEKELDLEDGDTETAEEADAPSTSTSEPETVDAVSKVSENAKKIIKDVTNNDAIKKMKSFLLAANNKLPSVTNETSSKK